MSQRAGTLPATEDSGTKPSCPDWDRVPFAVACARCGHDLRGLTEPKCPACGLEFDWADAIPLEELTCLHCGYHLYGLTETRCPECGQRFTWTEVLDGYHRRKKPLFEYRWRDEPVRSLLRSWRLAMRPWKLWREIDIHDPPPVPSLTLMMTVAAVVFALPPLILAYPGRWIIMLSAAIGNGRGSFFFSSWALWRGWQAEWTSIALAAVVWGAAGFGGLVILRQSMALCRVRAAHVVRVCAYGALPTALVPALVCAVGFVFDVSATICPGGFWYTAADCVLLALVLAVGGLWFWTLMSIALGYRLYIRMRHALWVAGASQMIALMSAAIAWSWLARLLR